MILHISTNQSGGAGIAARRLHDGLLQQGEKSCFLSELGTANEQRCLQILPRRYLSLTQRLARRFGGGMTVQEQWHRTSAAAGCSTIFTSTIDSDSTLLQCPAVDQATVINLHWVAGILPWAGFFHGHRCPIVWTLHDMNPFLGVFHYETDRQRAPATSHELDNQYKNRKRRILSQGPEPVIVAPSKWLCDQSQRSELFGAYRHEHIPYGLDTSVFKPHPQAFARLVFGLPTDRKLMLIVAERLDDHRKGFDLLLNALEQLELDENWELVAVGEGQLPIKNRVYHRVGSIHDERLMALVYSAADMTVISSREDNLPNVILESLCCGTPVIGTPAGGIPEPIEAGRDGFIATSIDGTALATVISRATTHTFNRSDIATEAARRYSQDRQAQRYAELYNQL